MPTKADKMKAFEEALKSLNTSKEKIFQSETGTLIATLGSKPRDVKTISSGSLVLDSILGGGIPVGRVIEIYGKEASGKTSIALTAAANVQKDGGSVVFIDLENALDPRYAKKLGVQVEEMAVAQPDYAEQALEMVDRLAQTGAVDLIIVDSVAALVPKAVIEGTLEDQQMALVARLMSKALPKLVGNANKTNTTIIFINQVRAGIGGYSPMGTPDVTTGGKALPFYCSQRIQVARRGKVMDGSNYIGNEVRLVVKKNKIAPPMGEGITILSFGKGINKAAEMIEVGPLYGVIDKPNNRTYKVGGTDEVIGTSKAAAVAALEADPALYERLAGMLGTKIQDALFDDVSSDPVREQEDANLAEENLDEVEF